MVSVGSRLRSGLFAAAAGIPTRTAVPVATFVAALALYVPTLMPGVGFWDTAEFQTVGPVLGIAHPTGFPTYTLLSWFASVVLGPFGETAFRMNLLSAILVAGAAGILAATVGRIVRRPGPALAAGLVLAVAPIAWWTANRADPHALHLFLLALLLDRLTAWGQAGLERRADSADVTPGPAARGRRDGWQLPWDGALLAASLVFGISLGNHGLSVLLAPGIALYLLAVEPGILRRGRLVLACGALIFAAVVVLYAYIPIRASMNPPLNYAHPSTLDGFLYLVTASQFHGLLQNPFQDGLAPFVNVFVGQQGWPVVLAAAAGFAALALGFGRFERIGPRFALLTGAWLVVTMVFSLGYGDGFIDRYYLGPLLVAAAWAAAGVSAGWDAVSARLRLGAVAPGLAIVAAAALLAWPAWLAITGHDGNDESRDRDAARWTQVALDRLEPDAVVVSWWSYSTPLWYAKYVEGRRPDMLVVDDRDRLDEGYGDIPQTIDRFRAQGRPVYLIRSDEMVNYLANSYRLEVIPTIPGYSPLWKVLP
jgi:4-amino-4-deoxy-L-arabinose transferase-like glycosyltransferase